MDAVQRANSGHPGMPMGMADIAEVLWGEFLKHNPGNPQWADRDRFVLSNGHGSMLLYSLLYLTGYPLDDRGDQELPAARQRAPPGHPEHDRPLGIETTTGPLGQGLANAVGMALAEKLLAAQFNRPGFDDRRSPHLCFAGDGCLMEGISHEACSFAGTLGLGKLIVFYDDNGISIDGKVRRAGSPTTRRSASRPTAGTWCPNVDGHDAEAVARRDQGGAGAKTDRPSLICCKTIIGWGAPNKQGTEAAHGEALGRRRSRAGAQDAGWEYPPFVIPDDIRAAWDHQRQGRRGRRRRGSELFERYQREHPGAGARVRAPHEAASCRRTGPSIVATGAGTPAPSRPAPQATRASSQAALNVLGPALPEMLGGSADLTGSNNTLFKGSRDHHAARTSSGNYMHYGVREFGMTAIMNGIALHGGFIPYGGTFLVFSDYARNAVRLACLMQCATDAACTRTTRSASARTARRTSRSSISPACARCRT